MYLFHFSNLPFALMLGISVILLILQGLGGDHDASQPAEGTETDLENPWLGLINVDRLPFSLVLVLFFFNWGSAGLLLNTGLSLYLQAHPTWLFLLLFPISLLPAVGLTRICSQGLARIFQENTAAITPDELIGCVGTVISGQVPYLQNQGLGRAHVYSEHGTLLQISCLAEEGCEAPQKNQTIFVTGYAPETRSYRVLRYESDDFFAYLGSNQSSKLSLETRLQKSQQELHKAIKNEIKTEEMNK
ncbi:MAG: DUF1449 family protein [Candidatus Sericytochromatia bacterium]|nr:DUF1449 family protein [Candidatus Sericytochromatia bacterium]